MGKFGMFLVLILAASGFGQEYNGEPPPKADVVYLLHADNLVETEVAEARMEERKKETAHVVSGASSSSRTPLAEPIFLILSEEIPVKKIGLWPVKVVKGNREIAFPNDPKKRMRQGPRPKHLSFRRLDGDLYWIEANEWLDTGEYCLSPEGSQKVFCFQVY